MTLTIQDLGALGELLGSVAVLATLVYLALQTRQNTMAIAAQVDAARINSAQHLNLTVATSSGLVEALMEDRDTMAESANHLRRELYWGAQFAYFQWQLTQARRGLLPTVHEEGLASGVVRFFFGKYRGLEQWWESSRDVYLPEFVEWVEEQRSKAA